MLAAGVTGAASCRVSLSPLQNHVAVGQENYVIFEADGEGEAGQGDLYAVLGAGGTVFPLTYTRVAESHPVLSPDGVMVAFLRSRQAGDSTDARVVVMNLLNGAERVVWRADQGRMPYRLGWHPRDPELFIATTGGVLRATVPPAPLAVVPAEDAALADSALAVMIGSPPFARVGQCAGGVELCVVTPAGDEQVLLAGARDAFRWGPDSVAYVVGASLNIRPLAGGHDRVLRWTKPPRDPRHPTVFVMSPRR